MKNKKRKFNIFNLIIYLIILAGIIISVSIYISSSNKIFPGKIYDAKETRIKYDINKYPKKYGGINYEKDNDGNQILILKTDINLLKNAIESIIKNYKYDNLGRKYIIDYTSDIYFDNIIAINYMIIDDSNKDGSIMSSTNLYYSKKLEKIIELNDILRQNYKNIAKYLLNIDLDNIKDDLFTLDNEKLTVYKKDSNDKIELEYSKNKMLFLAENGIPSLYEGEKIKQNIIPIKEGKKPIAFTFDDGPLNKNHDRIRALFDKYNQQTTFFMLGSVVQKNKEKLLESYKNGHEIANHSWNHPNLTLLSPSEQAKQILDTDNLLFTLTGEDIKYMRPPYGAYNETTKQIRGGIALWNVDSLDWKFRDKNKIINNVMKYIRENAVVLFHDLYDSTYEAVSELLPKLIEEGYQFVRYDVLEEYLEKKGR